MESWDPARLRVALVVDSSVVPAWVAVLAERLRTAPTTELEVTVTDNRRPRGSRLVRRASLLLEAPLLAGERNALEPVRIFPSDESALQEWDVVLDVADLGEHGLPVGSRYGVWRMTARARRVPGAAGAPVTTLYQTQISAELGSGRRVVLYESLGAIDPVSRTRTRNRSLWKAVGAFCHRLETVRQLGPRFLESCPDERAAWSGLPAEPTPAFGRRAVTAAATVAIRRGASLRRREIWFVAARPRRDDRAAAFESARGFAPLEASTLTPSADPFVFDEDGASYVFFERYAPNLRRGHIAYVELDERARPLGPAAEVLTAPYHLSYPTVFRYEDETYMLVESSANGRIELYRATAFPRAWSLAHVLLEGVRAFDATLHPQDGRLWLFVAQAEVGASPNDELHLYSSTSLFGHWTPHPLNPVVSDVRRARPAGRLFRHGTTLIRPSQDCSRRYGSAIVFNRIDALDETGYAETPIYRIEPTWQADLVATHTYNFGARVEVIDGKRVVRRPWPALGRRPPTREAS